MSIALLNLFASPADVALRAFDFCLRRRILRWLASMSCFALPLQFSSVSPSLPLFERPLVLVPLLIFVFESLNSPLLLLMPVPSMRYFALSKLREHRFTVANRWCWWCDDCLVTISPFSAAKSTPLSNFNEVRFLFDSFFVSILLRNVCVDLADDCLCCSTDWGGEGGGGGSGNSIDDSNAFSCSGDCFSCALRTFSMAFKSVIDTSSGEVGDATVEYILLLFFSTENSNAGTLCGRPIDSATGFVAFFQLHNHFLSFIFWLSNTVFNWVSPASRCKWHFSNLRTPFFI